MSSEIEPQGICFQLEWKKKTGATTRDEKARIGIWDSGDNTDIASLDWTTFKSYLCQNLGTMEDISIAYVDSDGDELPIESECEFQEALKFAKQQAHKGRDIILKLDTKEGIPLPPTPKTVFKKIALSKNQSELKESSFKRESKTKHLKTGAKVVAPKLSATEKLRGAGAQGHPVTPSYRNYLAQGPTGMLSRLSWTRPAPAPSSEEKRGKSRRLHECDDIEKYKKVLLEMLEELTIRQEHLEKKLKVEDDVPPHWFKKYMQRVRGTHDNYLLSCSKLSSFPTAHIDRVRVLTLSSLLVVASVLILEMKNEIIAEVTHSMVLCNKELLLEGAKGPHSVKCTCELGSKAPLGTPSKAKKKKASDDDSSDGVQGTETRDLKLLKKIEKLHKREKKLDSKLEKLETKTKRRMEKKSSSVQCVKVSPLPSATGSERKVARKRSSDGPVITYLMDAILLNEGSQLPDTIVKVGDTFTKVWDIMNNGTLPWTDKVGYMSTRTELRLTWGTLGLEPEITTVSCPILEPGEKGQISVNFRAPEFPGAFETYWHFHHMGVRFGHWIRCAVVVEGRTLKNPPKEENNNHIYQEAEYIDSDKSRLEHAVDLTVKPKPRDVELVIPTITDDSDGDGDSFCEHLSILSIHGEGTVPELCSDSDFEEDKDDNFVVVPMPPCFKFDVPIDSIDLKEQAYVFVKKETEDQKESQEQESSNQTSDCKEEEVFEDAKSMEPESVKKDNKDCFVCRSKNVFAVDSEGQCIVLKGSWPPEQPEESGIGSHTHKHKQIFHVGTDGTVFQTKVSNTLEAGADGFAFRTHRTAVSSSQSSVPTTFTTKTSLSSTTSTLNQSYNSYSFGDASHSSATFSVGSHNHLSDPNQSTTYPSGAQNPSWSAHIFPNQSQPVTHVAGGQSQSYKFVSSGDSQSSPAYTFDNQSQPVYYSYFGQNQSSTDSLDQGQSSAMYAPIGQSPSPYAPIGQSEPLQYYTHEYHTQPPLVYYDPPMCTNQDTMYIANRMPCVTSYVWGNHPQPTPLHAPEAQNASPYVFGAQDHQDEAQENISDVPVKLQQSAAPVYQKRSAMFAQGAQTQRPGSLNSALKKIIIKPSPNVYPPTAGTQRSNNKDKSSTLSAANMPEPQPASSQEAPIPPPPSAEVIPPPHGQLFYAVPNYYMPPQTSQVPGAETPQFSHTFVRQNSSAGIAPQVHILPETLMNGAINAASSAINTAKSVINNLRARPPTWGSGEVHYISPGSSLAENVQKLEEMGFKNETLNTLLLSRYDNDLRKVVAELCATQW
uniref:Next to BRCA1 central domain-containing protein n=1 Tax=Timema tahoe TaxID=61484 RepID=A0A7R9FMT3_9NEOP|nr:unnamed protein product [Timema tahoe]